MRPLIPLLRISGAIVLALSLSACVSLFPKAKPAQLYRFDAQAPSAEESMARPAKKFGVSRSSGAFVRSAAGDRIMTVTGSEVAYIADSRWSSPATTLFDEALAKAFDMNAGAARLAARGELSKVDYGLRVDVTRFEAVYDQGPKAAPMVVVAVRMSLTRNSDRSLVGSDLIETQVRAGDNRVGAIVEAFNKAVGQTLNGVVAWTNRTGAAGAAG